MSGPRTGRAAHAGPPRSQREKGGDFRVNRKTCREAEAPRRLRREGVATQSGWRAMLSLNNSKAGAKPIAEWLRSCTARMQLAEWCDTQRIHAPGVRMWTYGTFSDRTHVGRLGRCGPRWRIRHAVDSDLLPRAQPH